jgi:hypothetical protein
MPSGSEGNAQPASGVCAIALPASAPARIVAENSVRSIFLPRKNCGNSAHALPNAPYPVFKASAKGPHTVDQNRSNGPAYGAGALRLSRCRSKYTSAALNNIIHDE